MVYYTLLHRAYSEPTHMHSNGTTLWWNTSYSQTWTTEHWNTMRRHPNAILTHWTVRVNKPSIMSIMLWSFSACGMTYSYFDSMHSSVVHAVHASVYERRSRNLHMNCIDKTKRGNYFSHAIVCICIYWVAYRDFGHSILRLCLCSGCWIWPVHSVHSIWWALAVRAPYTHTRTHRCGHAD